MQSLTEINDLLLHLQQIKSHRVSRKKHNLYDSIKMKNEKELHRLATELYTVYYCWLRSRAGATRGFAVYCIVL
jgi:hypothetical protein